jgi:hypothetical protein
VGPATVCWQQVADLLWYAAGARGFAESGRARIPIIWSASPSAGGLQCIQVICIADDGSLPRLYDPIAHRWLVLAVDAEGVCAENWSAVKAVTGLEHGCTLRLLGDWSKLSAAYYDAETLLFRDAGCLIATLGLCAEWLDLKACPLGFVGDAIVPRLGFPSERFRAAGAVQISRAPSKA